MTRNAYSLLQEPREDTYSGLVLLAQQFCDVFVLVLRHSVNVSAKALAVLEQLGPFLLARDEESEWPGTRLFGATATVHRFALEPEAAAILAGAAHHLFEWTQPDLPEDPCFIRPDGSPWLVTIAHEGDAYMALTDGERAALLATVPGLVLGPPEETV